jgi:hypothetical protein
MTRPDRCAWHYTTLQEFRFGGRTYSIGDTINRRHLAIGPRAIARLIADGKIEVQQPPVEEDE